MNESSHTHEPPTVARYGLRSAAVTPAESPRAPLVDLLTRLDTLGCKLAADLREIFDRYDAGRITRMQLVSELDARLHLYPRARQDMLGTAVVKPWRRD